jgi:solute carrier family 25 citrate transporter 1
MNSISDPENQCMLILSQYPFEFAKTRVQLREQKGVPTPKNPFKVVFGVYKAEGIGAL